MADHTKDTERTRRRAEPMGTEKKRVHAERTEKERDHDPGAGEQLGEGVGGIGGTLAGAGIGSAAGPIGTIIGGIAGAIGGWWAGEKVGRAAEDWGEHEDYYRDHWKANRREDLEFDDARVGYGVGHIAGRHPDYQGRTFETVEPEIRNNWAYERHEYETLRPYVRHGYLRTYEGAKK